MKTAIFGSSDAAITAVRKLSDVGEAQLVTADKISAEGIEVISADMMRGKYDLIVLTEDADNKALAWQIGQFLKADGSIVTLQPSSPETDLYNYFGSERVAFGYFDGDKILLQDGDCAKKTAPILSAEISSNAAKKRFEAMAEAAFGGISSIAGCSMEMITSNDTWMDLMAEIVLEFTAVCAEENIYDITVGGYLPADLLTKRGILKKKYPAKKIISAIPDSSHKLPINEYSSIVAYAKKNGLTAPLCEITLDLLNKISSGELRRGPQNITLYK